MFLSPGSNQSISDPTLARYMEYFTIKSSSSSPFLSRSSPSSSSSCVPELDFFFLFSSMNLLLGAHGQANYCSANAFVDAFAQYMCGKGMNERTTGSGVPHPILNLSSSFISFQLANASDACLFCAFCFVGFCFVFRSAGIPALSVALGWLGDTGFVARRAGMQGWLLFTHREESDKNERIEQETSWRENDKKAKGGNWMIPSKKAFCSFRCSTSRHVGLAFSWWWVSFHSSCPAPLSLSDFACMHSSLSYLLSSVCSAHRTHDKHWRQAISRTNCHSIHVACSPSLQTSKCWYVHEPINSHCTCFPALSPCPVWTRLNIWRYCCRVFLCLLLILPSSLPPPSSFLSFHLLVFFSGLFAVDWPKVADNFLPAGQVHRAELPARLHPVARSHGVLPNGSLDASNNAIMATASSALSSSNRAENELMASNLLRVDRHTALTSLEKALQQALSTIMTIPVSKIDPTQPVCYVSCERWEMWVTGRPPRRCFDSWFVYVSFCSALVFFCQISGIGFGMLSSFCPLSSLFICSLFLVFFDRFDDGCWSQRFVCWFSDSVMCFTSLLVVFQFGWIRHSVFPCLCSSSWKDPQFET